MLRSLPIDVITLILHCLSYDELKGIGKIHPSFRLALKRYDFWRTKAYHDYSVDERQFRNQCEYNDRVRYLACRTDVMIWRLQQRSHCLTLRLIELGANIANSYATDGKNLSLYCQEDRVVTYERDRLNSNIYDLEQRRNYRKERFPNQPDINMTYHRYRYFTDVYVQELSCKSFPMVNSEFTHIVSHSELHSIINIGSYNYLVHGDGYVYQFDHCLPLILYDTMWRCGVRTQLDLRDLYGMPDDHGITHIQTEANELRLAYDDEEYREHKSGYYLH